MASSVSYFARAAKTQDHRLGGLNDRCLCLKSSGGWKFNLKGLADSSLGEIQFQAAFLLTAGREEDLPSLPLLTDALIPSHNLI